MSHGNPYDVGRAVEPAALRRDERRLLATIRATVRQWPVLRRRYLLALALSAVCTLGAFVALRVQLGEALGLVEALLVCALVMGVLISFVCWYNLAYASLLGRIVDLRLIDEALHDHESEQAS